MDTQTIINAAYLLAAVLFITGLKGLTKPKTAVRGNKIGSTGMLVAVVVTLFDQQILSYGMILVGLVVGGAIGAVLAIKIQMTGMPQMVAIFNGFGGIASALVAGAALLEVSGGPGEVPGAQFLIASGISGLIGSLTFTGSFIAFGKLQGIVTTDSVLLPGRHVLNVLLGIVAIGAIIMLVTDPTAFAVPYLAICLLAFVLGVLLTIPIGGADMPVVISLLNSYSGLAAAATGFVLSNNGLIIAGSLVGAAGIILTQIMCKAMNRSLLNVLIGGFGGEAGGAGSSADDVYGGKVTTSSPEEIAMVLEDAQRVVFVPGYGMAVAQAQHGVKQLANVLEKQGTDVLYAIHPVAGRMPGHMNVLLAEADVPYDQLIDMEEINPMFAETDVAIVIGANDVVNPVAKTDPKSPIAGMPILDVDDARTVVVIKRSLSPGFAGIPNPLFAADNTLMLFADAKAGIQDMVTALKETIDA
ncbi:MAG: NAD(P)(+) transhydrogenase (Re/Si-specific) subunit beta [Actinobacteria bacterium]|nr:NAD(P)(+) transhydrogenase (Re/Si-specific) subunit beta [Actinomycetota bacterium]